MHLIIIGIAIALIAVFIRICVKNKEKIDFYSKGLDNNFKLREIRVLWKLANDCNLETPVSLYVSVPTINKCISTVITEARMNDTERNADVQNFLQKLYDFRTRITLEKENKRGLESTQLLDVNQRLRVLLKGTGVFASTVLNNGRELVISIPKKDGIITISGTEWVGKKISVYLWRKGDASYVFDSLVLNSGTFNGNSCLYLQHTNSLLRAQKRQSVRCDCKIYAQMYLIKTKEFDYNKVETLPGYTCLLENISEDGAMIRIGGVGKKDVMLKLQFSLNDSFIIMFGVIRAVEYNNVINQSRLHFECLHIDKSMKNNILSYVYNVIPEDVKEINEAISQTESDALESGESEETVLEANRYKSEKSEETEEENSNIINSSDDLKNFNYSQNEKENNPDENIEEEENE